MSDNRFADAGTVQALIYQLVGAGSVCWENPGGAGIFDDRKAAEVAEDALARLHEINRMTPQLGYATNEQMLNELRTRIEVHGPGLDYRTVDSRLDSGEPA